MRPAALALFTAVVLSSLPGRAQPQDALAAARQLFVEAVGDEDARRYDAALEKFRRVSAVRETANVRYRIATCLDALDRKTEALSSYDAAARLGEGDPAAADVVKAAHDRASRLEALVSRLAVVLPPDAPAGTEVRIDDRPVDPETLGTAVPIEPGPHALRATAPGRTPFEVSVMLSPGGSVSIAVTLRPSEAVAPPPPAAQPEEQSPHAGAWVAFGVGGVLTVGAVVSIVLRQSNLSTMNRDCSATSSGALSCPESTMNEVNGARDAARLEGPLGLGLAAGAVAAVGVGSWLFLSAPSRGASAWTATPVWTGRAGALAVAHTW